MKILVVLFVAVTVSAVLGFAAESAKDTRVYEMRTYYAAPGKLDALHTRFRDHTVKLFEKHGMKNIGYWVPMDNTENKLIYILSYPSREAREASWKAFLADPDWQKAAKASEVDGKLVAKVETAFLSATDYSPAITSPENKSPRVFELRVYTAAPGRLENLNARFRDHTVKLFTRHGMTNLGYWTPSKGEKGADDTLIYILAHKSKEAAGESFAAFGKDPDWVAARKASEEKAGGSLTSKPPQSTFMVATDYSPIK